MRGKLPVNCLVKMNNNKKNTNYITAVCKSNENKLLGAERLRRMAEASSLQESFAILRENTYFGGEGDYSYNDFALLLKNEEKRLNDFVKEYLPDEECKCFCLYPDDFYNAEVLVKCEHLKLSPEKFLGQEGAFSVEQLEELLKGQGKFPLELKRAVVDAKKALENGFGGMSVGKIFSKALYACLLRSVKSKYLKQLIKQEIDILNLSIALRCDSYDFAKDFFISGTTLSTECLKAVCEKNESAVKALIPQHLSDIALESIRVAKDGKAFVSLEKKAGSLKVERMLEKRYEEIEGNNPFILYYCLRKNEIACVRTVLTGKQNGLDGDLIKLRMVTV